MKRMDTPQGRREYWGIFNILGLTALFVICFLPGIVLSYKSLLSPWAMFRISRAQIALTNNAIADIVTAAYGYRSEHLGGEIVQLAIIKATGITPEALALIPIGSLFIPILYYSAAYLISKSNSVAVGITLFSSFYYPLLVSQFSTQTYTWTNILFLSFLIIFYLWIQRKTYVLSILLIVIFIATFLHYHTTPLWMLFAVLTSTIISKLAGNHSNRFTRHISWALPTFFFVLYFQFDTVVYGNALARIKTESTAELFIQSLITRLVAPLFMKTKAVNNLYEVAPLNPPLTTFSTLFILLLLILPVLYWGGKKIRYFILSKDLSKLISNTDDIFAWSIVSIAVMHILMYSFYGAFSPRVIQIAFPLIIPIVVKEIKIIPHLEKSLIFLLVALAAVGFTTFSISFAPDIVAAETGYATWLIEAGKRVLSDPNVYGTLSIKSAVYGKIINFVWPSSGYHSTVIDNVNFEPNRFDYLVADLSNKPMITKEWKFLEPWARYVDKISANPNLEKIYDSERIMVFKPVDTPLSTFESSRDDLGLQEYPNPRSIGHLFIGVLGLFIIPGLVLVFMLRKFEWLNLVIDGYLGLVIGLSIVYLTFMGYLVNFLPLGLDWYIPIIYLSPWLLLLIILVLPGGLRNNGYKKIRHFITLFLIISIWVVFAIIATQAREQYQNNFTELFVTRSQTKVNSIDIHIVNRLQHREVYTLHILHNGLENTKLGPFTVDRYSAWSNEWQIPEDLGAGKITVTLDQGNTPYRNVYFWVPLHEQKLLPFD